MSIPEIKADHAGFKGFSSVCDDTLVHNALRRIGGLTGKKTKNQRQRQYESENGIVC
ncbi:hypothetical protein C943_00015 [Mariniradius saccharolyticus AK6]|uniref:Uncharacterized protein n=1 Tax=Mariniradius saccharolyticus AK6 TaxID=1239962 RepID=M7Y3B5_9BACT|nr:hypothetical protein C943_00015 [Mariniradius saccharolyticus AK6]